MKKLSLIAFIFSLASLSIAIYLIINRQSDIVLPHSQIPKDVVLKYIEMSRWDGTQSFFETNRVELKRNLELSNFLENDCVAIVFAKTFAKGRDLRFCIWLRKDDSGWALVPYLSSYISEDPFRQKWIEQHKEWLEEMESKKEDWEKQSKGIW
ncbi:MAG: hypothetical protein KAU06_04080 [Candidatus Marinimicrobia bacterium]|nr:hypothetical protein [Candidatus Neomarinimicrobiota bacterium]